MRVSVVYAVVGQAWEVDLDCPSDTCVIEAVKRALARDAFVEVELSGDEAFAVWNQVVPQEHVLQDGDRVEILRKLLMSPMERRRLYAETKPTD